MEPIDEKLAKLRRDFWPKMRKVVRLIPFAEDAIASYYCALDPATPTKVRATLVAALAYFILPLDMVPDFLAGAGFTDDAAVLWGALRMVGAHIHDGHRQAAREALQDDDLTGPDQQAA